MKLNSDKTLATVQINGKLDASAMDELIGQLAELRAGMTPAVALSRTNPTDPTGVATPITMVDSPAMIVAPLRDGRIRFWARSAGFGWLAFNVIEQDAMAIRDMLIANLPKNTNLIQESFGKPH